MVSGRSCLGKGHISLFRMWASFSAESIVLLILPGNNEKDRHRSRLGGRNIPVEALTQSRSDLLSKVEEVNVEGENYVLTAVSVFIMI